MKVELYIPEKIRDQMLLIAEKQRDKTFYEILIDKTASLEQLMNDLKITNTLIDLDQVINYLERTEYFESKEILELIHNLDNL